MIDALSLEEEQIQLDLEEIRLRKRLNEIKRIRYDNEQEEMKKPPMISINTSTMGYKKQLTLEYSKSARERVMRISDITRDGCIKIYGKNDSTIISRKYTMRSLLWIQKKLPKFQESQRVETNFWQKIADQYTNKFLRAHNESISDNTIEKLCYLVDSGLADKWFSKWEHIKMDGQTRF